MFRKFTTCSLGIGPAGGFTPRKPATATDQGHFLLKHQGTNAPLGSQPRPKADFSVETLCSDLGSAPSVQTPAFSFPPLQGIVSPETAVLTPLLSSAPSGRNGRNWSGKGHCLLTLE